MQQGLVGSPQSLHWVGEGNVDKVHSAFARVVAKGVTRDLINAHFKVQGAPFSVLNAPVTELGIITGGHKAAVKNILTKLTVLLNVPESAGVGGVFVPIT